MATMPRTKYLLVDTIVVVGEFNSLKEIAYHLGIKVSEEGCITFQGKDVHPRYIMGKGTNKFNSRSEVVSDWARCYMEKHLGHKKIYRFLT